jgi:hypothetical protein
MKFQSKLTQIKRALLKKVDQASLLLDNMTLTSCALIIIVGHLAREQFKSKKSKRQTRK